MNIDHHFILLPKKIKIWYANADLNKEYNNHNSPLHVASQYDGYDNVQLLIIANTKINF